MILNKYGAFVTGRVKMIPYRHHLHKCWLVVTIPDRNDENAKFYAVQGGDNEMAAENAYHCFLRDKIDKVNVLKEGYREFDEKKMIKIVRKKRTFIDNIEVDYGD